MIILICGLPRAGKTTYSQQYDDDNFIVLHLDNCGGGIRGHLRCNKEAALLENVVVEGVYNRAEWRKSLIHSRDDSFKKCIWLDTPIEMKKTRHGYCSYCEFEFEPPTFDEGWDEITIIRGDKEEHFLNPQKNLTSS